MGSNPIPSIESSVRITTPGIAIDKLQHKNGQSNRLVKKQPQRSIFLDKSYRVRDIQQAEGTFTMD